MIARDLRSRPITPECRGLPAAQDPSDDPLPRIPDPHNPVRRHIEQAVRLAVNEQPDATVEGAVVGLLTEAADLLELSDPAGATGGAS